jgi:hypothetical protein
MTQETGCYEDWRRDDNQYPTAKTETEKDLRRQIAELELKLYGDRKLSKCCGAILIPYISHSEKYCPDCKTTYPWNLDHGQKPLFGRSQD